MLYHIRKIPTVKNVRELTFDNKYIGTVTLDGPDWSCDFLPLPFGGTVRNIPDHRLQVVENIYPTTLDISLDSTKSNVYSLGRIVVRRNDDLTRVFVPRTQGVKDYKEILLQQYMKRHVEDGDGCVPPELIPFFYIAQVLVSGEHDISPLLEVAPPNLNLSGYEQEIHKDIDRLRLMVNRVSESSAIGMVTDHLRKYFGVDRDIWRTMSRSWVLRNLNDDLTVSSKRLLNHPVFEGSDPRFLKRKYFTIHPDDESLFEDTKKKVQDSLPIKDLLNTKRTQPKYGDIVDAISTLTFSNKVNEFDLSLAQDPEKGKLYITNLRVVSYNGDNLSIVTKKEDLEVTTLGVFQNLVTAIENMVQLSWRIKKHEFVNGCELRLSFFNDVLMFEVDLVSLDGVYRYVVDFKSMLSSMQVLTSHYDEE